MNYSELILNFCVCCVTTSPFCRCSSKLFLYLRQVRHRPRAERGRIRTHYPKLGRPFLEDILEHHRDRSPVSKWAVNVSHIHTRVSGTDPRRRACIGVALSLILKPRWRHFFIKFSWLCILAYRPQVIMEWNSISSALWFIHLVSSSPFPSILSLCLFFSTLPCPSESRQYDIHSSEGEPGSLRAPCTLWSPSGSQPQSLCHHSSALRAHWHCSSADETHLLWLEGRTGNESLFSMHSITTV